MYTHYMRLRERPGEDERMHTHCMIGEMTHTTCMHAHTPLHTCLQSHIPLCMHAHAACTYTPHASNLPSTDAHRHVQAWAQTYACIPTLGYPATPSQPRQAITAALSPAQAGCYSHPLSSQADCYSRPLSSPGSCYSRPLSGQAGCYSRPLSGQAGCYSRPLSAQAGCEAFRSAPAGQLR